ncbi:hypothetical protein [Streptomyces sp. NPDC018031]|uniref:hypothetical protein n=1 Tax=Streptomyces sp. NPDC018031 TaxID=3365033 RepID=UPI0037BB68C5
MNKKRRMLGGYLGAAIAVAALPGITVESNVAFASVILAGAIFVIVNQLVLSYPQDIRTAPPVMLAILGVVGVVEDTLIWLLVDWLGGRLDTGPYVDGFGMAVLGGLIARVTALLVLALPGGRTEGDR